MAKLRPKMKAQWLSHKDQKGFLGMEKKWNNLGKPKSLTGGKTTKIPDKQYFIKAK